MKSSLLRYLMCMFLLHFLQTLDHLPLTDPENFGTPVVQVRTIEIYC